MTSTTKSILTLILSGFIYFSVNAQCVDFTKVSCMTELKPYIYNGQFNGLIMSEGDFAELQLTFYSGQDYRVYVCGEQNLPEIYFRLYDLNHNLIFDNKEHKSAEYWDFTAFSTQQLFIEVEVGTDNVEEKNLEGCVSILVGFKTSEQ